MFTSVDAHVAGQAFRLFTFGVPRLTSTSIRDQYAEMEARHDNARTWLLTEPRGYAGMRGGLLVPAENPEHDYGVIFMSGSGYIRFSGHGVIALATILIETGAVPIDGLEVRITFDTYVGPIQARASVDQGRVRSVRYRNAPSFRTMHNAPLQVGSDQISVDVAFGGNWYVIVKADALGLSLDASDASELSRLGNDILRAATDAFVLTHPDDPTLTYLQGVVFVGAPSSDDATSRNASVYRGGVIDRSPNATGMAATMACMAADGELSVGDSFVSESIHGTTMTGRMVVGTEVGEHPAVTVEIAGRGVVTGMHQFFVDPSDTNLESLGAL